MAGAAYPRAPWQLRGHAVALVRPVDITVARRYAPPEVRFIPVWPGKTIGGIYYASYEQGSALAYSELAVIVGVARIGKSIGCWTPRLWVDSPASRNGGRDLWGMPKEEAAFAVEDHRLERRVVVRRGDEELCRLQFGLPRIAAQTAAVFPTFGVREDGEIVRVVGRAEGLFGPVRATLTMPRSSPYASLGGRPWLSVLVQNMDLMVPEGQVAGYTARRSVYPG